MTPAAIAAALRAIAKDARRPVEAHEDPDALLRAIAARLEALARRVERND
jgi:hypothetical protein